MPRVALAVTVTTLDVTPFRYLYCFMSPSFVTGTYFRPLALPLPQEHPSGPDQDLRRKRGAAHHDRHDQDYIRSFWDGGGGRDGFRPQ